MNQAKINLKTNFRFPTFKHFVANDSSAWHLSRRHKKAAGYRITLWDENDEEHFLDIEIEQYHFWRQYQSYICFSITPIRSGIGSRFIFLFYGQIITK